MAHFAIRGLMHEAALKADEDPDRLSFLHTVRVVRRKLLMYSAIPPPRQRKTFHHAVLEEILQEACGSQSRNRRNLRGVKRKMSNFPLCARKAKPLPPTDIGKTITISIK